MRDRDTEVTASEGGAVSVMTRVSMGPWQRFLLDYISHSTASTLAGGQHPKEKVCLFFVLQKGGVIVWKNMSEKHLAQCLAHSRCFTSEWVLI